MSMVVMPGTTTVRLPDDSVVPLRDLVDAQIRYAWRRNALGRHCSEASGDRYDYVPSRIPILPDGRPALQGWDGRRPQQGWRWLIQSVEMTDKSAVCMSVIGARCCEVDVWNGSHRLLNPLLLSSDDMLLFENSLPFALQDVTTCVILIGFFVPTPARTGKVTTFGIDTEYGIDKPVS